MDVDEADFCISSVAYDYGPIFRPDHTGPASRPGRRADFESIETAEVEIPYLKLHGSLNWSHGHGPQPLPDPPIKAVENPLILPPVFNKMKGGEIDRVWNRALQALRSAKNIIIVGYSLPKTDIYMQYFLKSAVGPNSSLQKIIVFDPVLHRDDDDAREMRKRYEECFAPQFANRINFTLKSPYPKDFPHGTLDHFVRTLRDNPKNLFFYP